jgi:hypothetical protein
MKAAADRRKDARMCKRPRLISTAAAVLLLGAFAACTEDQPCDSDQELRNGFCFPVDASAPAPTPDAAVAEAGAAFGQACTATGNECSAPAYYCALQPGQSVGFCSAFGCDTDPSLCPSTWTCMDLTPFGMAAHLCTPSQ